MSRPSKDLTWMRVAREISCQATCIRRKVGCVLLDSRGNVLSTGYNGVEAGAPHCNEVFVCGGKDVVTYPYACPGAFLKSGVGLDQCYALHAEWNALLKCKEPFEIDKCYTTTSPCIVCVKLLLGTSCREVYFSEEYVDPAPKELWIKRGRSWKEVDIRHVAAAQG